MIIASHLRAGSPDSALHDALGCYVEYTPVCAWPADCMVQWGNGIIPANPFFEAFPRGTFIRGDGQTIEEAERQAFAQFESEAGCEHFWGRSHPRRGTYTNGGGFCHKCGRFEGNRFREIVVLGHHRKPLRRWERDHLIDCEENADGMNEHMDAKYPERVEARRQYQRLLRLRMNLFGVDEESSRIGLFDSA